MLIIFSSCQKTIEANEPPKQYVSEPSSSEYESIPPAKMPLPPQEESSSVPEPPKESEPVLPPEESEPSPPTDSSEHPIESEPTNPHEDDAAIKGETVNRYGDSHGFLPDIERQVLDLINEERASLNLLQIEEDLTLRTAARIRSEELYLYNHFDHTRPNGDNWETVLQYDVPVPFAAAGENLAMKVIWSQNEHRHYPAQYWFDEWKNSPTHYYIMTRPEFTHAAIGIFYNSDGPIYSSYATTLFAKYEVED